MNNKLSIVFNRLVPTGISLSAVGDKTIVNNSL